VSRCVIANAARLGPCVGSKSKELDRDLILKSAPGFSTNLRYGYAEYLIRQSLRLLDFASAV
jgi:hypothetical protein